jgi:hypothetical protein
LLKPGFFAQVRELKIQRKNPGSAFYVQGSGALGSTLVQGFFFPKFLEKVHWRGSPALIIIKMAMAIVLGAL